MKYIKKLIRNSKRALNQQVIKKKQEIVKYAPRLTGIQAINAKSSISCHQTILFFCVFKNTYKKGFIEIFFQHQPPVTQRTQIHDLSQNKERIAF